MNDKRSFKSKINNKYKKSKTNISNFKDPKKENFKEKSEFSKDKQERLKENYKTKKEYKESKRSLKQTKKDLKNQRNYNKSNFKNLRQNGNTYISTQLNIENTPKTEQEEFFSDLKEIKKINTTSNLLSKRKEIKKRLKELKITKNNLKEEKRKYKLKHKKEKAKIKEDILKDIKNPSTTFSDKVIDKAKANFIYTKENTLVKLKDKKERTIRTVKKPVDLTKRTIKSTKSFFVDRQYRKNLKNQILSKIKGSPKNIAEFGSKNAKKAGKKVLGSIKRHLLSYFYKFVLPFALLFLLLSSCFSGMNNVSSIAYSCNDYEGQKIVDYYKKKELDLRRKVEKNEIQKYKEGEKIENDDRKVVAVEHNIAPIGTNPEELLAYLTVKHMQKEFKFNKEELDEIFNRMYKYYDKLEWEKKYAGKIKLPSPDDDGTFIEKDKYVYEGYYKIFLEKSTLDFLLIDDINKKEVKNVTVDDGVKFYYKIRDNRGAWQLLMSPFEDGKWVKRTTDYLGWNYKNKEITYRDYKDDYMYLKSIKGEEIFTLDGLLNSTVTVTFVENSRDGKLKLEFNDGTEAYLTGVRATCSDGETLYNEEQKSKKNPIKRAKIGVALGKRIGIQIKKYNKNPKTGERYGFWSLKKKELYVDPALYLTVQKSEKRRYDSRNHTIGTGVFNGKGKGKEYQASSELQKKIVDAAYNTMPYEAGGAGWCAKWVSIVYQKAGLPYLNGNANDMYRNYTFTSDRSKLKVGMLVAVESASAGGGGDVYGHIGIYVGDGLVLHNVGGEKPKVNTVDEWEAIFCKHHPIGFGFPPSVEQAN